MDDTLVIHHEPQPAGVSMAGMGQTAQHAKPSARRDHLWVLAIIAGFALFDVWESWTQVGNKSGFAHGTGWTLTVIVEAYACYALYGWFGAPGRRSRRFAMWSAFGVLTLSLVGQGSSVLAARSMPPLWLAVFVKDLPVVVLALIALLIHVRRLDRADADEAQRVHAEATQAAAVTAAAEDERATLRAELETLRTERDAELGALMSDLETARLAASEAGRREAEALTRADKYAAKLAAMSDQRKRQKTAQGTRANAQAEDITTEFRALDELQKDPALRAPRMGAELARRIGASPATGRRLHAKLTAQGQPGEPLGERSADQSDERSGERS